MAGNSIYEYLIKIGVDISDAEQAAKRYNLVVNQIKAANKNLELQGKAQLPLPTSPSDILSYSPFISQVKGKRGATRDVVGGRVKYISDGREISFSSSIDGNISRQQVRQPRGAPGGVGGRYGEGFVEGINIKDAGNIKATATAAKEAGKAISEANKSLGFFNSSIGKHITKALQIVPIWMGIRVLYQSLFTTIQEGIKFWADYEAEMAQIKVVGLEVSRGVQAQDEDYKNLGETILAFSQAYGIAAEEGLKAAKIFAQQGLNIQETIDATRVAMIGAQVLGEDVATVAENLTAAVRAYNITMSESLTIIDQWMAVQKQFAVTAKDLADGMKTAGATAAAFGISMEKFGGQLTAVIETTRKSGSAAANALQAVYTRLFAKEGVAALQQIADVPVYLDSVGRATMNNTQVFRQSKDVLDDLAKVWDKLSEAQQVQIAVAVGSRRQAAPFLSLMGNYNRAIEAEIVALNSAGDALESYGILKDTVKVKTEQLRNAWLRLVQAHEQTGFWKSILTGSTNLINNLAEIINKYDALKSKIRDNAIEEGDKSQVIEAQIENYRLLLEKQKQLQDAGNLEENAKLLETISKGIARAEKNIPGLSPQTLEAKAEEARAKRIREEVRRDNAQLFAELETIKNPPILSLSNLSLPGTLSKMGQWTKYLEIQNKYKGTPQEVESKIQEKINSLVQEKVQTEKESLALQAKITQENIKNETAVENYKDSWKEIEQDLETTASIMRNLGVSEAQIAAYKIQQWQTNQVLLSSAEGIKKIAEIRRKEEERITSELKAQADVIKNNLTTNLEKLFNMEQGFSDMFSNIGKGLREQVMGQLASGLSERLLDIGGIGNILGAGMVSVKNLASGKGGLIGGIESAHSTVYSWIVKGHKDGTSQAIALSKTTSGVAGYGGTTTSAMGGLASIFGGATWTQNKMPTGAFSTFTPGQTGPNIGTYGAKASKNAALFGGLASSALVGYSSYQSAMAGGASTGAAIGSGVLNTIGMMGMMSGNPVAMLGGGILMGLGALFGTMGKKSQTTVETQTTENRVSSKIDVTNKNLEVINRNLVALKTSIETYILPSSAYYSEKTNIEDEFSLFMRRGINA